MHEAAPFHADLAEGPDGGQAWWVKADDGVRIRVGHWPGGDKGTVLLFPGRTEYIEKYGRFACDLRDRGYGTFAIDWRGQGLADRVSDDPMLGHVGTFADYQADVDAALGVAKALNLPKPWFMIAHSMGGCIGLRSLHDGIPVAAAAFSAPMWGIRIATAMRPLAWVLSRLEGPLGFGNRYAPTTGAVSYIASTPFQDNHLTCDADMYDYMQAQLEKEPRFLLGGPSVHWFKEAMVECNDLRDLPRPNLPAVTYLGTAETVVHTGAVHEVMRGWPDGKLTMYPDALHEIPMESAPIRTAFIDAACDLFQRSSQTRG